MLESLKSAPAGEYRSRQMADRRAGHEFRTLWLSSLGGALEFYDFVIFVFFTGVIGKLFFSADLPDWARQTQVFGIFAAGYVMRPLGGIVMAHFGDRHGRKRMFTLSVLLMAIPTLLIGLLPTYRTLGVAAPLALLALRLVQGAAIGGEAPGGWVFVAEHARPGRSGLAIGLLTGGLTGGILIGSLVAAVVNVAFSPVQIADGLWRLPFLIGGVFGFIAMFLRRWLEETPVFQEMQARASLSRSLPLGAVLKRERRAVAVSMVCTWMLTAGIVVLILMAPALLQRSFGLSARATLLANLAGAAALCISVLAVGAATDRFGVRRVAIPAGILMIAATYGLFLGAERAPSALALFYALAGLGCGAVVVAPIVMVRAFPPEVRFTGVSLSYNVIYAIAGGLTPLLAASLAHVDRLGPAHYVAAIVVIGLVALLFAPVARSGDEVQMDVGGNRPPPG
jgi:MFS family permease